MFSQKRGKNDIGPHFNKGTIFQDRNADSGRTDLRTNGKTIGLGDMTKISCPNIALNEFHFRVFLI